MPIHYTQQKEQYHITTDTATFDLDVIHGYLTHSYWKRGVPKNLVAQAVANALCFGLFERDQQIGFARIITDYTDFAYLCDVFVLEAYQGNGLGAWLIETVIAHPGLQSVRNLSLGTRDAQEFYRKFGFQEMDQPNRWMIKLQDRPWYIPD